MIDTIILSVPRDKATMLDLSSRGVSGWDLYSRTRAYDKFTKNPSAKDKEYGYFPRLTGYRRKKGKLEWDSTIKIEFSAPKLIFENNLDELVDKHFSQVLETLHERMVQMGVVISKKELRKAPATAVHYSKNIKLQNGYTSQYVISELNKINLNKCFDLTRARFMNDGQSLYAYSQSHSFVIYDKVADLKRGKKRSIDREQSRKQLSLFGPLTSGPDPEEILRMEARLSQKRKLNSLFNKLGFEKDPTFEEVFDSKKSQAVLQDYWETMISKNSMVLFSPVNDNKDLLKQVLLTDRKMKGKEAIYKTGLLILLREGNGIRELRTLLSKNINDRTWYRMSSDIKEIGVSLSKLRPRDWYKQINQELRSYKPFNIDM
jgi:hypothetical protein